MFYFPCSLVHKICLLFTELNNEDKHIFRDSELRKQSANFKQTQRKQIIYFHVNRYIIWICQRFVKQNKVPHLIYRAISDYSRCQLLLQIDYVRLREKYNHYNDIFIRIYYLTLPLGNHLSYFFKQDILVPSSALTAVAK
jgi:hypothetical protein